MSQHYLPQFYLKSFADEEGLVWTYDRVKQQYLRLPPKVIAAENDLYSLSTADAKARTSIEAMLANLVEGPVVPVINKLTPAYRPTQTELEYLAMFVSFQKVRVPGVLEQINTAMKEFGKEFTRSSFATRQRVAAGYEAMRLETGEALDVDPEKLVEFVQSGQWDISIERHAILAMMLDLAVEMAPTVASLNWTFLFAAQGRAFITSDVPFVVVPPQGWAKDAGVGIATPGALKYLPLAPGVCLRMGEPGDGRRTRIVDGAVVRTTNANVAANSERFIFAKNDANLRRAVKVSHTEVPSNEDRVKVAVVEVPDSARYIGGSFLSHARHHHDQM